MQWAKFKRRLYYILTLPWLLIETIFIHSLFKLDSLIVNNMCIHFFISFPLLSLPDPFDLILGIVFQVITYVLIFYPTFTLASSGQQSQLYSLQVNVPPCGSSESRSQDQSVTVLIQYTFYKAVHLTLTIFSFFNSHTNKSTALFKSIKFKYYISYQHFWMG